MDPVDFLYPGNIGIRPPTGAGIAVTRRRDAAHLVPGWWTTYSPLWSEGEGTIVRLYWSVEPACLFGVVAVLTESLGPALPYALKCPLLPERCQRPDGVVLYLPARAWEAARSGLKGAYRSIKDRLREGAPALTRPLARGLALAEDPGEDSFGMDRSRLLATGMREAAAAGAPDREAVARAGEAALRQRGLRLAAPYLNAGSHNCYRW